MNSSTGDFTEVKKSLITQELYTRATQSCIKSKAYPKKAIPLKPLNLEVIKKELEESWDESLTDHVNEHEGNDNQNAEGFENTDVNNLRCPGKLYEQCNDNLTHKTEDAQQVLNIHNDRKHNPNLSTISEEKSNALIHYSNRNDSFDLDFSALSLQTPVKNNVSNTEMHYKTEQDKKQFGFLTPKISSTILPQNSLAKEAYFKTPRTVFTNSLQKSHTPSNSLINKSKPSQRISFKIPFNEINQNCEQELESTVPRSFNNSIFKRMKVNDVEYVVLNLLGKGGSSEVYHCFNIENKCHCAIKCVSLQNSSSASSYINEVKLLQQLQSCEKIIKMYDYEIVNFQKKLLVVLEKGGEDLSTILKRLATQQSHLRMYILIFYWMEMLYAVKEIHSHGIIHSDLKPANFLKAEGGLKLIDFGIATSVQTDMTSVIKNVPEGSCNYISPEALSNEHATNSENKSGNAKYKLHYKSDVWSLGCILYQLVYRRTPFQHISQLYLKLAAIMNPDYKIDYPDAIWVSPKIIKTIQKCLQYNVRLRPSVDELIAEYQTILNNI